MARPWRSWRLRRAERWLTGAGLRRRHLDHALGAAFAQIDAHLPLLPLRPIGRHVRHGHERRAHHPGRAVVTVAGVAEREAEAEADAHTAAAPAAPAAAAADPDTPGWLAILAAALLGQPLAVHLPREVDAAIRRRQFHAGYRLWIGDLHFHGILLTFGKAGDHRVCRGRLVGLRPGFARAG